MLRFVPENILGYFSFLLDEFGPLKVVAKIANDWMKALKSEAGEILAGSL